LSGNALAIAVFFLAAGAGQLLLRVYADRTAAGRRSSRLLLASESLAYLWRQSVNGAPLVACGFLMFGVAVLVPRQFGAVLALLGIVTIELAIALTHLRPMTLMPGWLRAEVAAGIATFSGPDRADWILFWILVVVGIVGDVAVVLLITGMRSA